MDCQYKIINAMDLPGLMLMPIHSEFKRLKAEYGINPELLLLRECSNPQEADFTHEARIAGLSVGVNKIYLLKRSFKAMLRTLYHEFYHAFQQSVMENSTFEPYNTLAVHNITVYLEEEAEKFSVQQLTQYIEVNEALFNNAQTVSKDLMEKCSHESKLNRKIQPFSDSMALSPALMEHYNSK